MSHMNKKIFYSLGYMVDDIISSYECHRCLLSVDCIDAIFDRHHGLDKHRPYSYCCRDRFSLQPLQVG
jgi:hypothetical protein